MSKPFNPHPKWREHFTFKPLFPHFVPKTQVEQPLTKAQFVPDPIIEKFKD